MSVSIDKPRINFASVKNPLPYPDFLEVQLKSFRDFFQLDTPPEKRTNEGLYKVFAENSLFRTHEIISHSSSSTTTSTRPGIQSKNASSAVTRTVCL